MIGIVSRILTSSFGYIWLRWFGFRLEPIFATAPAAPKTVARCKSGQKHLKNNHLTSSGQIRDELCLFLNIGESESILLKNVIV